MFATGTIVRSYTQGQVRLDKIKRAFKRPQFGRYKNVFYYVISQVIDVTVLLTANHLGFFQFRICANNDVTTEVTQACLDQSLLADSSGRTQYVY